MKPTILGDDVIRIVDARVLPLREQLFRPFSEHVAPGFELATAALVRTCGDRIDLLPAALTWFAFLSWIVMLCTASWWAVRMTGRSEVARLVFVFVGVSSACIEVPWWFSAATYSLSAACIFAVLGIIAGPRPPGVARFAFICFGTLMALSFSAIGLLAVILGGLASLARTGLSKATGFDIAALSSGFAISWSIATIMGGEVVATESTRFSFAGFAYALAVPGGVALPLYLGLDAHAVTVRFSFATGIAITLFLALFLMRSRLSKSIRIDLAAMALVPYMAIYPTRAALVKNGAWSEPDFLYFWASRYHLFMTVVLSVLISLAIVKVIDLLKSRSVRMAWILYLAIVAFYTISQFRNANRMRHFENQPDQASTLTALVHLRNVACKEGISIERLERIMPPVRRGWNASVLELRPDCFPLVRLIARRSDFETVDHSGANDDEMRRKVIDRLGLREWRISTAHRLTNLDSADELDLTGFRQVDPVDITLEKSGQIEDLAWIIREDFGHVEFTIRGLDRSSIVIFEHLQAEGTVNLQWSTDDIWDDFRIAEFESKPSANCPVPERIIFRNTDFEKDSPTDRYPSSVRFRVKSVCAGALRIGRILVGEEAR
ncbi:hypothetical protein GC170_18650 [bacterium]|nr:hypothetical protein [bacterium]